MFYWNYDNIFTKIFTMNVRIYKLVDPRTDTVRYIGMTVQRLCKRLCGHVHHAKHNNSIRDKWIKELLNLRLRPIISLVEEVDKSLWQKREKYWIAYYRKVSNLTNICDGGNGSPGMVWREESIQSISEQRSKAIYALTFDYKIIKEYKSCKEAGAQLNTPDTNISNAARSDYKKSAAGYLWKYVSEYKKEENKSSYKRFQEYKKKKVDQCTLEGVFIKRWDSIEDAANTLNIKRNGITRAKIGCRKTYNGFIWRTVN